jgi:hypothetical protein
MAYHTRPFMITDKQLEDIAKLVVTSPKKHPLFVVHLAKAYLAADDVNRMLVEKAWEPVILKIHSLKEISHDPQMVGWMDVISKGRYSP